MISKLDAKSSTYDLDDQPSTSNFGDKLTKSIFQEKLSTSKMENQLSTSKLSGKPLAFKMKPSTFKIGDKSFTSQSADLDDDWEFLEENEMYESDHKSEDVKKCCAVGWQCKGRYRTWWGRKTMRGFLLADGLADNLELEKRITKEIINSDFNNKHRLIDFDCYLVPCANSREGKAEIWLMSKEPEVKEFSVFATFFKSFFIKTLQRQLTSAQLDKN